MRHFSGEFEGVRLLMADELDMIAGGNGEDTDDVSQPPPPPEPEIVVNGIVLPRTFYYFPPPPVGWSGEGHTTPEENYPEVPETPCVETQFASSSVTVGRVNEAAAAAGEAIRATGNSDKWEYSTFIYEYGGNVLFTPPFTNNKSDQVDFSSNAVPPGAHVLAILHNQPDAGDGVDQRMPSSRDWSVYNAFAGNTASGGRTFDSNMLSYIFTNQDNKIRPYDNTDKNQTNPSCGF